MILALLAMIAAGDDPPAPKLSIEVEVTRLDSIPESARDKLEAGFLNIAKKHAFHGEYLIAREGKNWAADSIPRLVSPVGLTQAQLQEVFSPRIWRWASVTKQIIATLVMQEVAAGRIKLDAPVASYLPRFKSENAKLVSVRQLLRHQSGLPNPDDTAASPGAVPAYNAPGYAGSRDPLSGYCAGPVKRPPGGDWEYNNCDYLVIGALLEAVTGKPWEQLVESLIAVPLGMRSVGSFPSSKETVPGFVDGKPENSYDLASFGASAGLYGTARDLLRFDQALIKGELLPATNRDEMWDGQAKLGFIALGQWVFTAPLKGCSKPMKIVERRGAIGGVEVRNLILPDADVVLIAFVDRAGFDFGEIWQGKGFSYDMLSAAACP